MRQLVLDVQLRDSSVFASYFAGANRASVQTLIDLKLQPHAPVVWVWGPQGTGKSHLLQAVCARAGETGQPCAYFPLAQLNALGPEVLDGCGELSWVCL